MSLFLFLIPAAIGGALTGYYGNFNGGDYGDIISDESKSYATLMRDEDILKEALRQYGVEYSNDKIINTNVHDGEVFFLKNDDGNYDLIFNGDFSDEDIENFTDDVFEYYKRIVQERTYQKVMQYIKQQELEYNEEITGESDVVLTLTLN